MVSVICASDAEMPRSALISGSDGRYMSSESGVMAVMLPRNKIKNYRCPFAKVKLTPPSCSPISIHYGPS